MVLKLTAILYLLFGGLVVRVASCHAGMPGSILPRHGGILFFLKIQEACTLTTFVEQKLSLCVKKLRHASVRE